jgi:hypothetical protein
MMRCASYALVAWTFETGIERSVRSVGDLGHPTAAAGRCGRPERLEISQAGRAAARPGTRSPSRCPLGASLSVHPRSGRCQPGPCQSAGNSHVLWALRRVEGGWCVLGTFVSADPVLSPMTMPDRTLAGGPTAVALLRFESLPDERTKESTRYVALASDGTRFIKLN